MTQGTHTIDIAPSHFEAFQAENPDPKRKTTQILK